MIKLYGMKKITTLLIVLILFIGCKKNSGSSNLTDSIIGTYHSTDITTNTTASDAIVEVSTVNSSFIKITYNRAPYDPKSLIVFDSVKLFNDKTFTVNQKIQLPINNGTNFRTYQATGSGNFETNAIHFNFILSNFGDILLKFNGVR